MTASVQVRWFENGSERNAQLVSSAEAPFTVITLPGESDAYTAPRVRSDLATALGSDAPLVVDLSRATFIDSTIVAVLLEGLAEYEKRERPLLLLLPDDSAPEVHRLFELTGLASLLPLVRSWDEVSSRVAPH
jgi:anti-anti-sigma factor